MKLFPYYNIGRGGLYGSTYSDIIVQFFIDTLIPTEKDNQKFFWFRAKNTVKQARFRPHGPKTTPELGYNLSRLLKKVGRWFNTLFQCIFRCWVDWNWFQDPGRYSKFINGQFPTKQEYPHVGCRSGSYLQWHYHADDILKWLFFHKISFTSGLFTKREWQGGQASSRIFCKLSQITC